MRWWTWLVAFLTGLWGASAFPAETATVARLLDPEDW